MDVGYWLYDVVTKIQLKSDVKLTSGACWVTALHMIKMCLNGKNLLFNNNVNSFMQLQWNQKRTKNVKIHSLKADIDLQ